MEPKQGCISKELLKNAAPIMFGLLIVLGFFGVLYGLLTHEYPAANKDPLLALFETLKAVLIMAVSFFFGTSASNKSKDDTISEIAKSSTGTGTGAPPPTPTNTPGTESAIPAKDVNIVAEDVTILPSENQPTKGVDI